MHALRASRPKAVKFHGIKTPEERYRFVQEQYAEFLAKSIEASGVGTVLRRRGGAITVIERAANQRLVSELKRRFGEETA